MRKTDRNGGMNMAKLAKGQFTRSEILCTAARMFLEYGYSNTSPKMVCKELEISLGNLTYYFPTKEDILAVLIEWLAEFQWKTVRELVSEGESLLAALGFELTAMAVMCEESPVARDLYIAAYTSDKPLEIIRKNDMIRAKEVFAEFCPDWTDDRFAETEVLVSGIEYTTLRVTDTSPPLETRIAGAMDTIFRLYNVPEERRRRKIEKALGMDYHQFARKVLSDFKAYVEQTTQQARDEAFRKKEAQALRRGTPS